jgi:hypothetical protein
VSRREDIDTGIYSDPDFTRLSPIARSVYIWSWTNSHCGMSGLYKIDRRLMEFETGWTSEQLTDALGELHGHKMVFYDDRVLYVKARVKKLRTKSPNIAKSIARDLENVGWEHEYVRAFMDRYSSIPWLAEHLSSERHGTPTEPLRNPPANPSDPSEGVQGTGKGKGKGKEGGAGGNSRSTPSPPKPDELPSDLPEPLHPTALVVAQTLARVAAAKGSNPVTLAAVGRAMVAFPGHDHATVASDVEHWWVHGLGASKPVKDVVATYRNRLSSLPAPTNPGRLVAVPSGRSATEERMAQLNRRPSA